MAYGAESECIEQIKLWDSQSNRSSRKATVCLKLSLMIFLHLLHFPTFSQGYINGMINRTVSSEADHSRPPMSGKAGANLTWKACFPELQVFLIRKCENTGLYQCFLNVVNISLKNIRWVIVVVLQKTCL